MNDQIKAIHSEDKQLVQENGLISHKKMDFFKISQSTPITSSEDINKICKDGEINC